MTKPKAITKHPVKEHPGLYRIKLNCAIGRDALDGKTDPPAGASRTEYALFCLLHAMEELAQATIPKPNGGIDKEENALSGQTPGKEKESHKKQP
jgi:hypothetical protein